MTIDSPYALAGYQCSLTYTKETPSLNVVLTVLSWPFEELVRPLGCFFLQKCHSIIWNSFQFLHWVRFESIKPQVEKKLVIQDKDFVREMAVARLCTPPTLVSWINEWKSQHSYHKTDICYLFLLLPELCQHKLQSKRNSLVQFFGTLLPVFCPLTQFRPFPSYLAPLF